MKSFFYIVKNRKQDVLKGVMRAASEEKVCEYFRKQGYMILTVEEEVQKHFSSRLFLEQALPLLIPALVLVITAAVLYVSYKIKPFIEKKPTSVQDRTVSRESAFSLKKTAGFENSEDNVLSNLPSQLETDFAEDDIIRIKLRGTLQKQAYGDTANSYYKALDNYKIGMLTRDRMYLEEAIRYAQYVLSSSADKKYKEAMSSLIRNSRRIMWNGKLNN